MLETEISPAMLICNEAASQEVISRTVYDADRELSSTIHRFLAFTNIESLYFKLYLQMMKYITIVLHMVYTAATYRISKVMQFQKVHMQWKQKIDLIADIFL